MASKIKVDNITDQDDNAVISRCGSTHTVTAQVYKANTIQDTSGNAYFTKCGTTITMGASGDTVTIPSGATISNLGTAAGFGSTGEVSWNTTKVTTGFTATSGVGYFADTTGSAFTITLPASPSAGNVVAISDYSGNFGTNAITVGRNSSNINGAASDFVLSKDNVTAQFIYVDGTQGWRVVFTGSQSGDGLSEKFITATGGTITTSGNCKVHTFTGPGTFTVTQVADCSANNAVGYLVVAGGGGTGRSFGGGAGAGGFREGRTNPVTPYTASPLVTTGHTVTAQGYPITVGAGGAKATPSAPANPAQDGSNSVFSSFTSSGGGGGGHYSNTADPSNSQRGGHPGGSGGGAGDGGPEIGSGNTPPVSPPQGNNGGAGASPGRSGAGGGATAAGTAGANPGNAGTGGAGATTHITGSPVAYAGGGGGYGNPAGGQPGGVGGGGNGGNPGQAGTANTGGGAGGTGTTPNTDMTGTGGSGIVIIRYKFK